MSRLRSWVWSCCALFAAVTAAGCAPSGRAMSITTKPDDALILIDGQGVGRGNIVERMDFSTEKTHHITVTRYGFKDEHVDLVETAAAASGGAVIARQLDHRDAIDRPREDLVTDSLSITLRPRSRRVTFGVTPVPLKAIISVDGKPLSNEPVSQITTDLEFTVDANNKWIDHTVTAVRAKYKPVELPVRWIDQSLAYALPLEPLRKDLHITTIPPHAEVFLNGESRGEEPVSLLNYAVPIDPDTNEWVPQRLTAKKPGYFDAELKFSWDDGRTDYKLELASRSKLVRITTDPPGAVVRLDGTELPRDANGVSTTTLAFTPSDDKGSLKTFAGTAATKVKGADWESAPFAIPWDDGRQDYKVSLAEVKTRQVPLARPRFSRADRGWRMNAEIVQTTAMRDVSEPPGVGVGPAPLYQAARGVTIDSLAVSPDGSLIVFTTLTAAASGELHGQLNVLDLESGKARPIGDDTALVLTPSISPDGARVLFSTNRAAGRDTTPVSERRLSIWSIPVDASAAATALLEPEGGVDDLWPSLDSQPRQRLFFQSLLDGRADPRLYFSTLNEPARVDLAQAGQQPRVSPKADSVLFSAPGAGGRRDLFTVSDKGGLPINLTNTFDADDFDAVWSTDGAKIAFASDRARAATRERPSRAITTSGRWTSPTRRTSPRSPRTEAGTTAPPGTSPAARSTSAQTAAAPGGSGRSA